MNKLRFSILDPDPFKNELELNLEVPRVWWRAARPAHWLFPSWRSGRHLNEKSLQTACREAALRAGFALPSGCSERSSLWQRE